MLLVALFCGAALAQGNSHGHGNGNGHGKGNPHNQSRDDDDHEGGRWESRGNWEYRTYDGDRRPPGWNKGKKTGWGHCDLPPGQAKKYGCNTYSYGGRSYYWYRDDVGRIVVRRPIVSAHAGIDIH
jgi:hypothetical protein